MSTFEPMAGSAKRISTNEMRSAVVLTQTSSDGETLSPDESAELSAAPVLCTDLDGTLLKVDSLWESVLTLIKSRPGTLLLIPIWLLRGKAAFKAEVARRTSLNPATLPYREDVLEFLRKQKESGAEIVLATGSPRKLAESISNHLGFFDVVLASDESLNCVGESKLSALREILGDREFDYVGNGTADLALWRAARRSLVVTSSAHLTRKVREVSTVVRVFHSQRDSIRDVSAALRIQHWAKNLLLFTPLLLAHKMLDPARLWPTILAFFTFSLLASTGYVINDLFDLDADRLHSAKKFRPFASGALPIWFAFAIIPLLAVGTLFLTWSVFPAQFAALLTSYFACSVLYSQYLKRIPVLDVLILAGLYTLRVLAGGVAAQVPVSPWLLGFCMFLFLSLAYVKRFSEMLAMGVGNTPFQNRRGYYASDRDLFRTLGPISGYISVLVFALYLNGREVAELYHRPQYLWFVGPLLLYWITRIWLIAERGQMLEDPVVFAMRDKASYVLGVLVLLFVVLASL
jgi:4-hydroxybenzoate polyprenyltransferase